MLELGAELESRDLDKERLSAAELDKLIGAREYTQFLNTRNELYRKRKMKEKPPSRAEAIQLMAREPNLIRRPVVIRGGQMVLGFDEEALKKLPIAKLMRWGSGDAQFVRPVHGLVMLHDDRVVPGRVLGIEAGRTTRGHRFHAPQEFALPKASAYLDELRAAHVLDTELESMIETAARGLRAAVDPSTAALHPTRMRALDAGLNPY